MQPYQQQYGNPMFGQQPMFNYNAQQTAFQPMNAPAYMPQSLFGNYQSACRWCTQPFGVSPPLFGANDPRAFHNGKMCPEKAAHQTKTRCSMARCAASTFWQRCKRKACPDNSKRCSRNSKRCSLNNTRPFSRTSKRR
jgi:hypothetical protein